MQLGPTSVGARLVPSTSAGKIRRVTETERDREGERKAKTQGETDKQGRDRDRDLYAYSPSLGKAACFGERGTGWLWAQAGKDFSAQGLP